MGARDNRGIGSAMRVLICDQESEMLETVARWFEVDTATSKVTCIDLMRANPFDVVIASERLSDGSGLELLSHIATRWPDTLRVLVIEPPRLKLLRGKLHPFKLHATMRYPIEEDELEAVLNRMGELMSNPEEDEAEEEPTPEPSPPAPTVTTKIQKVTLPQQATKPSSPNSRTGPGAPTPAQAPTAGPSQSPTSGRSQTPATGSSQAPTPDRSQAQTTARSQSQAAGRSQAQTPKSAQASKPSARAAKSAAPLGAPLPPTPPPVRRKLGNYTPLGSPEDEKLRIVQREFDHTAAPLAARAIRAREEALKPREGKEKLGTLATHLRDRLKKLLKR